MASQVVESLDHKREEAMEYLANATEQEVLAYERYRSVIQQNKDKQMKRHKLGEDYNLKLQALLGDICSGVTGKMGDTGDTCITYPTSNSYNETSGWVYSELCKIDNFIKGKEEKVNKLEQTIIYKLNSRKFRIMKLSKERDDILNNIKKVNAIERYNNYKTQIDEANNAYKMKQEHWAEYQKAKGVYDSLLELISKSDVDIPMEKTMEAIKYDRASKMAYNRYIESRDYYDTFVKSIPDNVDEGKKLVERLDYIEKETEKTPHETDNMNVEIDELKKEINLVKSTYIKLREKYNDLKNEYQAMMKLLRTVDSIDYDYACRRWTTAKNKWKSYVDKVINTQYMLEELERTKTEYDTTVEEFETIRDEVTSLDDDSSNISNVVMEEKAAMYATTFRNMKANELTYEESKKRYASARRDLYVAEEEAKRKNEYAMEYHF